MREKFFHPSYLAPSSFAEPGRLVFRPMIPILVHGKTKAADLIALVDTGAEVTTLPMRLCEAGLLDPTFVDGEEEVLVAANGLGMLVKYGIVDLSISIGGDVHRWMAKVGFSEDRDEAVLGDVGFLRYFKVLFDRHRKFFVVELSGTLPPPHIIV